MIIPINLEAMKNGVVEWPLCETIHHQLVHFLTQHSPDQTPKKILLIGLLILTCFGCSLNISKTSVTDVSPQVNSADESIIKKQPEWLIKSWKENPPKLNFAVREVREFVLGKISAALKYDIDGIQLDGIRFQTGQGFSYDDATCKAFKKKYGRGPLELRWHNCGSAEWCEWMRWNATHVTALVREIKETIRRSGKDIPLSAAVFPDYESAGLLIGQNWRGWIEEGIVDMVCPGIGVRSSHNKETPEGVNRQVKISREEDADGGRFLLRLRAER